MLPSGYSVTKKNKIELRDNRKEVNKTVTRMLVEQETAFIHSLIHSLTIADVIGTSSNDQSELAVLCCADSLKCWAVNKTDRNFTNQ